MFNRVFGCFLSCSDPSLLDGLDLLLDKLQALHVALHFGAGIRRQRLAFGRHQSSQALGRLA